MKEYTYREIVDDVSQLQQGQDGATIFTSNRKKKRLLKKGERRTL
jgi:hypothetical protein